jgi:alpha-amylase/alpha-mannosidase (GH57 family)
MSKNNKYICIHGHFYQPPRENAWLEFVELQDSAKPFHDWNERINFECYAPNSAARILDDDGFIKKIFNNYSWISHNFGPTLLSWMEKADPSTYQAIIESDQKSMERFNGHGSAIAQAHSHLILPLANEQDKHTQVIWGIRDFEYRYNRKPEGMWLAETATNTESLEVLAAHDIKFTILAPRQAKAFRKKGDKKWIENGIDPRRPYLCNLPSGKSIVLFFYDGNLSQEVAFKGILNNGKNFATRLLEGFDNNEEPQLVHIATDGESYGHHHRYGEMALADGLNYLDETGSATVLNYAAYLEKFPPEYEVQIHENSSWSCAHGIERWRSNCGCSTGGRPEWNQHWRKPLRDTLDWLRDKLIPIFEKESTNIFNNPWEARNNYIKVLLNRNDQTIGTFIKENCKPHLSDVDKTKLFRLMEMQRNAMLMFTSCGWFFDEISGIETNQILQYALRAIHYAELISGTNYHPEFLEKLEAAPSNVHENGATAYKKHIIPSQVGLDRAGMHFAMASLFEKKPEELSLFNYTAKNEVFERTEAGIQKLVIGRTNMKSNVTYSAKKFSFAVLYLGQQNMIGNISFDMNKEQFEEMKRNITTAFSNTNLGDVIAYMQEYFGPKKFTIWHLFRDEKRKILKEITEKSLKQAENTFREIYNDNYQLMTGIRNSGIPVPVTYIDVIQNVINSDLHSLFQKNSINLSLLTRLSLEIQKWQIPINDQVSLEYKAGEAIYRALQKLNDSEFNLKDLQNLNSVFEILTTLKLAPSIWKSQNLYFSMMKGFKEGDWVFSNQEWHQGVQKLGNFLQVKIVVNVSPQLTN